MTDLIIAIIGLIYLICFFVMAANISAIKSILRQPKTKIEPDYWFKEFSKHYHWHNQDAALRALQEGIWLQLNKEGLSTQGRIGLYENLKEKYEPVIIELKGQFLKFPFSNEKEATVQTYDPTQFTRYV
ncbi:hypothetical protein [Mucilaginibacter sp. PAMB04168]|uniref:hypothetical protein n=1 Tax=Mucilaginibacter sp. PAMB04168 TaxID=3138567 RepID=UPI0031F643F7